MAKTYDRGAGKKPRSRGSSSSAASRMTLSELDKRRDQASSINQRLEGAAEKPVNQGMTVRAFGSDVHKRYAVRYEVREMGDLITSNTESGSVNPAFPTELQPRDRTRAASQRQIDKMASNLEPEALTTEFMSVDRGSPIIGLDNAVESGNARAMALRRAAREHPEQYEKYRTHLKEAAEEKGIDSKVLDQYDQPVLVRVRLEDVDRVEFAKEANTASIMGMSATEKAQSDAAKISTTQLMRFESSESGRGVGYDLRMAKNRPFVRSFVSKLPEYERGEMLDRKGELTQTGESRIKAAMFTRVYRDERLSDRIFESRDNDIKRITGGLMSSLGPMAKAEEMVATGQRSSELSIAEDVGAAVGKIATLQEEGLPVEMYLQQETMEGFGADITDTQRDIMVALHERRRSGKKVRELMEGWTSYVESQPHPDQSSFLSAEETSRERAIRGWLDTMDRQHFGEPVDDRQGSLL